MVVALEGLVPLLVLAFFQEAWETRHLVFPLVLAPCLDLPQLVPGNLE